MKDFFVYWTARGLIIPFVTLICVLLASAGPARAAKNGSVEIGFVGVPPKSMINGVAVPNFQNVLLNIQSVRINPKANSAPGNGKWQTIPVPPSIGNSGQSADLQIDLNSAQNVPQIFNTAAVRVDTYRIAQIVIDSQNPGTLIPNCPSASPIGNSDGCINYPIQLVTGDNLFVTTPGGGPLVSATKGTVAPLILQLSLSIVSPPTTPGGAYLVSVTASPVTSSVLGQISGSVDVSGSSTGSTTKIRKLAVTAELLGTNTPIATSLVQSSSSCPTSKPCFTLMVPAAGGPASPDSPLGFGTLYDLALAGGADTYAAERLQPLYPGQMITVNPDFAVTAGQTLDSLTGSIVDGCVPLKPVVGATLSLLIPPDSNMSANCLLNPGACVAVATATTDNTGFFPLPGTITTPAAFNNIPKLPKNQSYAMQVTAPGYAPLVVQAIPGSGTGKTAGTCTPNTISTTFGPCDLALQTAYITGAFPIMPPISGQTTLVQVFAEDHDSNNIESALSMPVPVTPSNSGVVPFTINVPPSVPAFDLFATTIDLYQGSVDPYQGHNIVAMSNVAAPAACATATPAMSTDTINCVGHGSLTGTVMNPNLGTSVVVEKLDPDAPAGDNAVQVATSLVQNQPPNQSPSSNYAFCVPADTYQLQKFQLAVPDPSTTPIAPTPTPAPTGDPVSVTIPAPPLLHSSLTPTPSPTPTTSGSQTPTPSATPTQKVTCPTTCSNPDGSCPGICNNFPVQPL